MNSSYDEEIEVKSEPEIPVEDIKTEETDMLSDEYIHYEYLKDSPISNGSELIFSSDESECSDGVKIIEDKREKTESRSPIKEKAKRGRGRPPKRHKKHSPDVEPKRSINAEPKHTPSEPQSETESEYNSSDHKSDTDSDYSPPSHLQPDSTPPDTDIINDRMTLKNYKRTPSSSDCIFKNCDLKDTAVIPNIVRIKLLHEYKLYILRSSKACSIHIRDQNWEDLMKCTYNDFTATDIEDILQLLKQGSQIFFDFEQIELIPTRFMRYWMNVNKVQYQRIFDKFPCLKALPSPKTALAVYLMYLQNNDVQRISLLLQIPETEITNKIQLIQDIVPCRNYKELNDMFQLEY